MLDYAATVSTISTQQATSMIPKSNLPNAVVVDEQNLFLPTAQTTEQEKVRRAILIWSLIMADGSMLSESGLLTPLGIQSASSPDFILNKLLDHISCFSNFSYGAPPSSPSRRVQQQQQSQARGNQSSNNDSLPVIDSLPCSRRESTVAPPVADDAHHGSSPLHHHHAPSSMAARKSFVGAGQHFGGSSSPQHLHLASNTNESSEMVSAQQFVPAYLMQTSDGERGCSWQLLQLLQDLRAHFSLFRGAAGVSCSAGRSGGATVSPPKSPPSASTPLSPSQYASSHNLASFASFSGTNTTSTFKHQQQQLLLRNLHSLRAQPRDPETDQPMSRLMALTYEALVLQSTPPLLLHLALMFFAHLESQLEAAYYRSAALPEKLESAQWLGVLHGLPPVRGYSLNSPLSATSYCKYVSPKTAVAVAQATLTTEHFFFSASAAMSIAKTLERCSVIDDCVPVHFAKDLLLSSRSAASPTPRQDDAFRREVIPQLLMRNEIAKGGGAHKSTAILDDPFSNSMSMSIGGPAGGQAAMRRTSMASGAIGGAASGSASTSGSNEQHGPSSTAGTAVVSRPADVFRTFGSSSSSASSTTAFRPILNMLDKTELAHLLATPPGKWTVPACASVTFLHSRLATVSDEFHPLLDAFLTQAVIQQQQLLLPLLRLLATNAVPSRNIPNTFVVSVEVLTSILAGGEIVLDAHSPLIPDLEAMLAAELPSLAYAKSTMQMLLANAAVASPSSSSGGGSASPGGSGSGKESPRGGGGPASERSPKSQRENNSETLTAPIREGSRPFAPTTRRRQPSVSFTEETQDPSALPQSNTKVVATSVLADLPQATRFAIVDTKLLLVDILACVPSTNGDVHFGLARQRQQQQQQQLRQQQQVNQDGSRDNPAEQDLAAPSAAAESHKQQGEESAKGKAAPQATPIDMAAKSSTSRRGGGGGSGGGQGTESTVLGSTYTLQQFIRAKLLPVVTKNRSLPRHNPTDEFIAVDEIAAKLQQFLLIRYLRPVTL